LDRETLLKAILTDGLKYGEMKKLRRSQWPGCLRRRSAAKRLLGLRVRSHRGMDVCLLCMFVLSGRGLFDGPIPRPEESYRLWCVSECDQVKINNLDTCCEQLGGRGKVYERTTTKGRQDDDDDDDHHHHHHVQMCTAVLALRCRCERIQIPDRGKQKKED
jgi:hypothetical protein